MNPSQIVSQGTGKRRKGFFFDDVFVHLGIVFKHKLSFGCLVLSVGPWFCYAKDLSH